MAENMDKKDESQLSFSMNKLSSELQQKEKTIQTLRDIIKFRQDTKVPKVISVVEEAMKKNVNNDNLSQQSQSISNASRLVTECMDLLADISNDTLPKLFDDTDSIINDMKMEVINVMEQQLVMIIKEFTSYQSRKE